MNDLSYEERRRLALLRFERDLNLQKQFGCDFEAYWAWLVRNRRRTQADAPRS